MKCRILLISMLWMSALCCHQFYSQVGQDRIVYETYFAHNPKKGFFVDIGAHNGVSLSNTFFYEKELGWQGICIEPIPEIFEQLRNNRSCICINGCISDRTGIVEFTQLICPSMYIEMLSGITEKYDPKHIQRINSELAQCNGSKKIIKVQSYLLADLLDQYGIDEVDYLSLDTEGGELDILRTIPFKRIKINVISVENNYGDPNMKRFLESQGFKLVKRLEWDELYVRKDFLKMLSKSNEEYI